MAGTMYQAQETFVAEQPDGTPLRVIKGEVFHGSHYAVKLDQGRDVLMKPIAEAPEDDKPARKPAAARKPVGGDE